MSFHNKPNYQIPELIEALKAHRLPHDTPSQLADSFRIGWMACRELAQADSVPAVEREQERIAFKDAHRHLDLDEVPDAWGRPMFKHSHVEASWFGWIASASHGKAPAGAGEAAEHYRNAIARARLLDSDLSNLTERGAKAWAGVDAQALREGGASPSANAGGPSAHIKEPYTLAEIKAKIDSSDYSAEMMLQHAMLLLDSVQEDAALWHWLAEYLVGTRTDLDEEIVASETVNDLRKLVKAAIKQGEKQ